MESVIRILSTFFRSLPLIAVAVLIGCQEAGPRPTSTHHIKNKGTMSTHGSGGKLKAGTSARIRDQYRRTGRATPRSIKSRTAGKVNLSWDAPTHRENGEGLYPGEIRQYIISYGRRRNGLRFSVTVEADGTRSMQHSIVGLDKGTWYFTVQTVDLADNVSQKADVVEKSL